MGAVATDSGVYSPATEFLSLAAADLIFQRALKGKASPADGRQFTAHMLCELARMSTEDGDADSRWRLP
ncbi:MAG TPA: hypothetical protein VMS73_07185 [Anaerolineaceae bacterium]|nr:hypothetical protein [Anaerolineaceae bacterium]